MGLRRLEDLSLLKIFLGHAWWTFCLFERWVGYVRLKGPTPPRLLVECNLLFERGRLFFGGMRFVSLCFFLVMFEVASWTKILRENRGLMLDQQFQGTILLMVFDLQGIGFNNLIYRHLI